MYLWCLGCSNAACRSLSWSVRLAELARPVFRKWTSFVDVGSTGTGWAHDLPAEAHGSGGEAVVTAPSPGHLFCMRLLERDGLLTIEEAQEVSHNTLCLLSMAVPFELTGCIHDYFFKCKNILKVPHTLSSFAHALQL